MKKRKTERLSIRLSEEEKGLLLEKARTAGYENNLGRYLIEKGMEQSIPYTQIRKDAVRYLSKEVEDLKRIDQKVNPSNMEIHKVIQERIAEVNKIWLVL